MLGLAQMVHSLYIYSRSKHTVCGTASQVG